PKIKPWSTAVVEERANRLLPYRHVNVGRLSAVSHAFQLFNIDFGCFNQVFVLSTRGLVRMFVLSCETCGGSPIKAPFSNTNHVLFCRNSDREHSVIYCFQELHF
ncbi:MAG: hypothetical protein ACKOGG_00340, partial [Actinomycetota bacterium]